VIKTQNRSKVRSDVYWQGALKPKGVNQMKVNKGLYLFMVRAIAHLHVMPSGIT
jgi:hypothetical protein